MSLVAVVTRPGDRAGELPETRIVPVGMPQDTDFGAYFASSLLTFSSKAEARPAQASTASFGLMARSKETTALGPSAYMPPRHETAEDILLGLASRMDSDGGMPGKNRESRALATVIALLAFVAQGHTPTRCAFRSHVTRLVSFLESLNGLASHQQQLVAAVIALARKGTAPAGEWTALAHLSCGNWTDVEKSVLKA